MEETLSWKSCILECLLSLTKKVETPFASFAEHFFTALGERRDMDSIKYKCLEKILVSFQSIRFNF
jgi:hypothetical protein